MQVAACATSTNRIVAFQQAKSTECTDIGEQTDQRRHRQNSTTTTTAAATGNHQILNR
jgi:hypothetical protein